MSKVSSLCSIEVLLKFFTHVSYICQVAILLVPLRGRRRGILQREDAIAFEKAYAITPAYVIRFQADTLSDAIVDGRALAAHYSFAPQSEGMAKTDVLDRYRSFAEENICVKKR